jgi:hypothetical protein
VGSAIGQRSRLAIGLARKECVFFIELLHDLELTQNYTGDYLARKPHLALVSWAVVFSGRQCSMQVSENDLKHKAINMELRALKCLFHHVRHVSLRTPNGKNQTLSFRTSSGISAIGPWNLETASLATREHL